MLLLLVPAVLALLFLLFYLQAARSRRGFLAGRTRMSEQDFLLALGSAGMSQELVGRIRNATGEYIGVDPAYLKPDDSMATLARMQMFDWDNEYIGFALDEYLLARGIAADDMDRVRRGIGLDDIEFRTTSLGDFIALVIARTEQAVSSLQKGSA